jgi:ADP-heptose:LPS heptosyltransferase
MVRSQESAAPIPWHEVRRIAVLRALYLGDLLCSVPALRALRKAAPQAKVTLLGLPWAASFCRHVPRLIDRFVPFPGYPGLPEQPVDGAAVIKFFAWAQSEKFDVGLQLHGSGAHVNDAMQLLGAKCSAGSYLAEDDCPDPATFMPYPAQGSEIERNLQLTQFLGAPSAGTELEFEVTDADYKRLDSFLATRRRPTRGYVCLHAGAKWQSRRWPVEHFAAVGNALAAEGHPIVLTGGPGERPLVEELSSLLRRPHANLCGHTDLGGLAAAVKRARLVITNDTGVSHVAAAMRTPSVVVVLGSDPDRWAPMDRHLHEVVARALDCRPCSRQECPADRRCGDSVSVEQVLAAAHRVMDRTYQQADSLMLPEVRNDEPLVQPSVGGPVCVA